MGVAAEIGQHGLWATEGRFGVDHPFDSAQGREPCREDVTFGQPGQITEEDQIKCTMQNHQPLQKQTPEQSGQDPDRQEKPWTARDPSRAIRRQASAGDNDVDMRMMGECRAPGMQDAGHADARAQVPGIACDGGQCLG
ncbi:hypothetical protein LAX5112_04656 [Roseibium alexandrii]|uniref:Uncharacterized protein n=1 Tax=Roseibium alexandrii TaxID=388408 RepID=A0A0M7AST2_9HYPH|nr:hypothetical protein LAX5112_04656 [Roseibium alexandrii]